MDTSVADRDGHHADQNPPAWALWIMRGLAVVALCICGYLAWHAFQASEIAGCAGDGVWNCGHVLHSRWSKVGGIPVSGPAGLVYGIMIVSLVLASSRFSPTVRQWAWGGVTLAAVSAGAAALWFITLQVFVLRHVCAYCMTVHAIGLVLLGLVVWLRPLSAAWGSSFASVGILGVLGLITTQLASEPPKTYAIETYSTADPTAELAAGVQETPLIAPGGSEQFSAPGTFDSPLETVAPTSTVTPEPTPSPEDTVALTLPGAPQPSPSPTPQLGDPQADAAAQSQPGTGAAESGDDTVSDATDSQGSAQAGAEAAGTEQAEEKPASRQETYLGGRIRLNTYHWPIIGDPGAEHVLVELFDYTCPHCRTMNQHLKVARQHFGDRVAILALPVPLDRSCNDTVTSTKPQHQEACELAKLSVAVWRVAPDRFEQFHNWLFEPSRPRTMREARLYAEQLVDAQALRAELAKPIPGQFISQHVELYKRAGAGAVPKLLFTNITVKGEMRSADELIRLMERELNASRSAVAGP